MVDAAGPLPDSNAELLAWLSIAGIVFISFGFFTGLDGQAEFVVDQPQQYFLSFSESDADLVFQREDVRFLNRVSSRAIGSDPVASERLYCLSIKEDRVTDVILADDIEQQSLTSVAGSCVENANFEVDGFVHSQPGFTSEFSEEDKSLESRDIQVSCIQWAEITKSPVTGEVRGLNCAPVVDGELKTGEKLDIKIS